MLRADFADGIVPAVVPVNAGLAVDEGPGAVGGAARFPGITVGFQGDVEIVSAAVADFPFTDEVGNFS